MSPQPRPAPGRRQWPGALVRYVFGWLGAGLAVVLAATILIGGDADDPPGEVALPPVTQIDLVQAARSGGCRLAEGSGRLDLGLPTGGPGGRSAAPGVYEEPVAADALVGALRRGIVVFHVGPDIPAALRDQLRRLQTAFPRGTILTINRRMPFAVAATAWQHALACPRVTRDALDALRLFRGRFIGSGPEAP